MCKLKLLFARLLFKLFSIKRLKDYSFSNDIIDSRDYRFSEHNTMSTTLQEEIDLREFCSPIEDQLNLGSCVSQSLVGNLEFLENKKNQTYQDLSRLFVYYTTRLFECQEKKDSGSQIRDGIKVLKKYGVCLEPLHPYISQNYAVKPSDEAFNDAKNRVISSYYKIETLDEMLQCLNQGFPFVGGIKLYPSFAESFENGIVPVPRVNELPVGKHAIMYVGFNLNEKYFLARNSWGTAIQMQGYFKIPFEYASQTEDCWTIRS